MRLVSAAKAKHRILVPKDKLTTRGLIPSSQELFDMMHLTTCEHAMMRWRDCWMFCPVCLTMEGPDGEWMHKTREEILV